MVPPIVDVRGLRMADWRLESSSSTRRRPSTSPSGMAVGGPDGSVLACVGRVRGAQVCTVTARQALAAASPHPMCAFLGGLSSSVVAACP